MAFDQLKRNRNTLELLVFIFFKTCFRFMCNLYILCDSSICLWFFFFLSVNIFIYLFINSGHWIFFETACQDNGKVGKKE